MKVKFKYGIRTYSGTVDEMTYGSYRKGTVCISRKHTMPRITEQNESMGAILKNLGALYRSCDPDYVSDLKAYATKNSSENVPYNELAPTAYAIFTKMMFAWKKSDPEHVDLATINLGDIVMSEAPVLCIADAVDGDLLARVKDYETLDNPMGQ
ncbi:MAG: hypothetical protein PHI68_00100 [Candidatus Cloacimonetes bacterium]|nr:hypothetical protein [Candidatus Cloacimonadota bacterium]